MVVDEVLGELTLDKDLYMFEGEVLWRSEQICLSLEVDAADEDTWADARRASAARELTNLACEWRESADEEVPEITEESFAQRIELRSIAMDTSRLPASHSSGSRTSRFLRISGAGQY